MCENIKMFDILLIDLSNGEKEITNKNFSEQNKKRPCVVISNDIGNLYSPTIIILPLTTKLKKLNMPTHCILRSHEIRGLDRDSMVLGEQIRSIDKNRVLSKIAHIDNEDVQYRIVNVYMSNMMGAKQYSNILVKISNLFFKLIKKGDLSNGGNVQNYIQGRGHKNDRSNAA